MMDWIMTPEGLLSLGTLTFLEIVLGVDNIIFISILAGKLPQKDQEKARKIGLMGAFVSRLVLLSMIAWIVRLQAPLFEIAGHVMTGKGLVLLIGGLFLIFKATREIHAKLEGAEEGGHGKAQASLTGVIIQVMLVDVVFSLDSVITAVGMTDVISVMVTANVIALGVMLLVSGSIGAFVDRHPTVKMLALSFLILIGFTLIAEAWGLHIPKGYLYFAMGFSMGVEVLNIKAFRTGKAVKLKGPH